MPQDNFKSSQILNAFDIAHVKRIEKVKSEHHLIIATRVYEESADLQASRTGIRIASAIQGPSILHLNEDMDRASKMLDLAVQLIPVRCSWTSTETVPILSTKLSGESI